MASGLAMAWIVLAGLALVFTAQYGRQIRSEPDDQDQSAGPVLVAKRASGALGSVVSVLLNGAERTVAYLRDMTKLALVAFGLVGGGIAYVLVGLLQFDPVAWLYVAASIVSSMEVFGVGIISRPWLAIAAVGGLFAVLYLVKWLATHDDDD